VVDKFIVVSYVIQNTDSKAATVAGVSNSLAVEQVREAALAIEMFSAGTFGEPTAIDAASTPSPGHDKNVSVHDIPGAPRADDRA
jgi:heptaprenylglyceryl phosphate synthase